MAFERFKPEVRRAQQRVAFKDYRETKATIDTTRPVDQLRTDVTEMLGERTGVLEGHYRRKADSIHEKVQKAEHNKDHKGMRESYLRYRNDRATIKIQRIQEKTSGKPGGLLDRQRHVSVKNLEYKQKIRNNQINALETKRQNKPEQLQKKIDQLIQKKLKAVMRKAERNVLREQHGVRKHDFAKRAEVLARLTPQQKRQIVREAILLVRRENIARGKLDDDYEVDDTNPQKRDTGFGYERTT